MRHQSGVPQADVEAWRVIGPKTHATLPIAAKRQAHLGRMVRHWSQDGHWFRRLWSLRTCEPQAMGNVAAQSSKAEFKASFKFAL